MPSLQLGDTTIELNEHGFLVEPKRWNDEVAQALTAFEWRAPALDM